jgi:hypothetical protein
MEIYSLEKSSRKEKKLMIRKEYPNEGKIIHFGASGYEDYLQHKDEKRKYRSRAHYYYTRYYFYLFKSFYVFLTVWLTDDEKNQVD